ncbi:MAG: helix-turn-helix domain-containing protein [Candidatus Aminicenantales bacterium]
MFRRKANDRAPAVGNSPSESSYGTMARELVELYVRQTCLTDHLCLRDAMGRLERDIILHVLTQTNGNQHEAAEILGVKPTTLHYKLRRMGITAVHRFDVVEARPHH